MTKSKQIHLSKEEASLVIRALLTHRDEVQKHAKGYPNKFHPLAVAARNELKAARALLRKLEGK